MKLCKIILPIALVISSMGLSQEIQSADVKDNYIEIDLSQSHPNNRTIDRLYYLSNHSDSVELPADVLQFLESIDDGNDPNVHEKYTFQRSEILKVLYNERISPEDKKFICNHYLQITDSQGITPIHLILQKYIDEGKL